MTKKEIIERLYVLRSILSVISLRVDEVKEKEAEIEEMKRIKSYLPTTIINEKEELAKKKRIFLKPNRKKFISSVIKLVLFILVVIFSLICVDYVKNVVNLDINFVQAYCVSILFGIIVIISIPGVIKNYRQYKQTRQNVRTMNQTNKRNYFHVWIIIVYMVNSVHKIPKKFLDS